VHLARRKSGTGEEIPGENGGKTVEKQKWVVRGKKKETTQIKKKKKKKKKTTNNKNKLKKRETKVRVGGQRGGEVGDPTLEYVGGPKPVSDSLAEDEKRGL